MPLKANEACTPAILCPPRTLLEIQHVFHTLLFLGTISMLPYDVYEAKHLVT